MKKYFTLTFLFFLVTTFATAQVRIGGTFTPKLTTTKPDSAYFGDIGIRGSWIAPDLDKDGKPEILVTDYTRTGRVHAFQAAGNDTLEWIWSSPRLDLVSDMGIGGSSTPRVIRSGDLDGDGKGEIIFPRNGKGYLVFEWDGIPGSHKFGSTPSAVIPSNVAYGPSYGASAGLPNEGGLQAAVEHFEVFDIDKDGKDELLLPKNLPGTANDDFLIISADGEWDFENPGFSSFKIEGSTNRLATTSYGGGSPRSIHPADLDGEGKYELLLHNWSAGAYFVMKVPGADTYVLADVSGGSTNGNQYYQMTPGYDHSAFFGAIVGDINKDGDDEVFFPFFDDLSGTGGEEMGNLFIVNYKTGDDVFKANENHAKRIMRAISQSTTGERISSFTGVVADLDGNGKREVLVASAYPSNVVAAEYQGGDVMDSASYIRKVYYAGENNIYATITYSDSVGIKTTVTTIGEGFVSKMSGPRDIDGDGKLELILPYQSLTDSTTVTWRKWKSDTSAFVVDSTKKFTNSKKWIFRALERDIVGSVESKNLTVITPDDYQLLQNYPNPFNPSTTISFILPLAKKVTVRVYDMLGKEIITLAHNQDFSKGTHNISWNGKDQNGKTVASGAYVAMMSTGNVEKSIKMMMMK